MSPLAPLLARVFGTPAAGQARRPLPLASDTEASFFQTIEGAASQTSQRVVRGVSSACLPPLRTKLTSEKGNSLALGPLLCRSRLGSEGDGAHVPESAHTKEGIEPTPGGRRQGPPQHLLSLWSQQAVSWPRKGTWPANGLQDSAISSCESMGSYMHGFSQSPLSWGHRSWAQPRPQPAVWPSPKHQLPGLVFLPKEKQGLVSPRVAIIGTMCGAFRFTDS